MLFLYVLVVMVLLLVTGVAGFFGWASVPIKKLTIPLLSTLFRRLQLGYSICKAFERDSDEQLIARQAKEEAAERRKRAKRPKEWWEKPGQLVRLRDLPPGAFYKLTYEGAIEHLGQGTVHGRVEGIKNNIWETRIYCDVYHVDPQTGRRLDVSELPKRCYRNDKNLAPALYKHMMDRVVFTAEPWPEDWAQNRS